MMILNDGARSLVNLLFGLVGVWMAHAFYPSPRKLPKIVAAWLIGFGYCTVTALLVEHLGWFPGTTHEHLSNVIGFGAIFVYLYLFPQIPVAQRIFTYFFVDNSLYILVTLSRLIARRLTVLTSASHSAVFTVVFLMVTALFLCVFSKKLKEPVLQRLAAFHDRLRILTVYASLSYLTMLALCDPWSPMEAANPWQDLALLLLCGAAVCGYLLAFALMRSSRREQEAVSETRELAALLSVSQRYYSALVGSIEEARALRHDFIHHLRVMDALQKDGKHEDLDRYLAQLLDRAQSTVPVKWCACYVANVLLDYYAQAAKSAGVDCSFDAAIPAWDPRESTSLCVILGNLLQNALEACQRVPQGQKRFLSLLARVVNGNLILKVENSFDGVLEEQNGKLSSRKEETGHGLGLASIRSVAQSKGGFFETSHHDTVFLARVVLPLPKESAEKQTAKKA